MVERSSEQSKQLTDLQQENKELKLRVKDLERLFLNAKGKLDAAESKARKLGKDFAMLKESHEELDITFDYYKTVKDQVLELLNFVTKPVDKKICISMRFLDLNDTHVPVLVEILKQCPYADTLDLEGNRITDLGVKILCQHLKSYSCRVASVLLSWNEIGEEGAWALVEAIMARDFEIENNIQLEAPQKLSKVVLSFNQLSAHTALINKTMQFLISKKKDIVSEMNITRTALMRAPSAKTVGQAFKVVNEAFAEITDVKSLIAVLDRVQIEHHELTLGLLEKRKLEERFKHVQEQKARPPPPLPRDPALPPPEDPPQSDNPAPDKPQPDKVKPEKPKPGKPKARHAATPDLASSLTKELNIPFLLSKRPAFPLSFIEKTISAGLEVNAMDKNLDETLLMYAARTGNLKLAQLMVEKRAILDLANVRNRQSHGENAFIIACKHGNFDVVDFLLSKGSKIGSVTGNGASAMHLVVKEGNHDSICRLVERGLSLNLVDNEGRMPLHLAAEAGDISTVVRLLQLGADLNAADHSGRTPAAYAEENNHYQVLEHLTALGGRNQRAKKGVKEDSRPRFLGDLGIGKFSPVFKGFLENADRTLFSIQKTQEMLEERALENLH